MASIAAFTTSLVFNGGIALLILVLYSVLRSRFDYVYQPNFKLLTEVHHTKIPERKLLLLRKMRLSPSLFAWITAAFKLNDSEAYELVGFDAFVYLRFMRLCFKIAAASFPYVIFVLIPVNVLGDNGQTGMDQLTLGNVAQKSNELWAHLLGVWLFSFLVYYFLYTEWRVYVDYRQRYLKENLSNHFSVLVTQLPYEMVSFQQIPSDEGLKKLVQKLFPDQVAFCYAIENTEDWRKLLKKHDNLVLKLERAQAVFEEKGERPQHRLKPLIGEKVDSVRYYDEQVRNLQEQLHEQKSNMTRRAVPAAIVTFKSVRQASIASQALWQAKSYHTIDMIPAPRQNDIIWKSLEYPLWSRWIRWSVITTLLFLLVVFWMIPVTFIASLVTLDSLQKKVKFLRFVNDLPTVVVGLIEGVLSTIVFVVFFAILPLIMQFMSRQEGLLTSGDVARSVIEKLYVFTIVNKFLGSVLAGAFFDRVKEIIDSPTSLPKLLAMSLPSVATFFINIIILQSLTGRALSLLRLAPLIICNIKKKWLAKTKREHMMVWAPPSPSYGQLYSNDLFVFIIGVTYCIQAPIVVPFVMFYFGFGYIVHFYLMVYVMRPAFNYDGKMWITVFNRMVLAVVVFQILMIGIFALKNNPTVSSLSLPPLFLTIIFYIFINMYWKRISFHMELDDPPLSEAPVDEEFLQAAHKKYIRNRKVPFLFALSSDDAGNETENAEESNKSCNEKSDLDTPFVAEPEGSVNMTDLKG